VRGRNGVFSSGNPFQLTVYQYPGACANVSALPTDAGGQPLPVSTTSAPAGNYKTIILTDINRMAGSSPGTIATSLENKLAALAARPEVNGVIVNVGSDPWVAFFNAQADSNFDCPFAKNLVAQAIQAIINRSRAGNSLQYVVLVGDDSVIPFFRYPDEALLGPERNYIPPVKDLTSSQASLRLDYVLGQDAYGAQCNFSLKSSQLPLPDLAVGRLVQTPAEVMGMVDAYLSTPDGQAPVPSSSLVTGYDFLADDAQAVASEFGMGIGSSPDTLISPNNLAPSLCWTADDLRLALFGKRHDLIFLAGHFSASDALAADYATHVPASELANSTTDFRNSIIFSAGCHSGYDIVTGDAIPLVTDIPDWTRACALKQATLVAGTGYQYGDTDFIEYGERLYLEFAQQLRSGNGPVPVGQALLNAKHLYLSATPEMRGIHAKTYLEASLFGLPMLSVNMPGTRRSSDALVPAVASVQHIATDPGATLGLTYADLAVTTALVPTQVVLNNTEDGTQTIATFLSGGDSLINNPAEPILPVLLRNVTVPATVLRGVGFRGGSYADLAGIVPLTGAAATEIRGVHATFLSDVFYPIRPWNVNYFGALCGGLDGLTRLMTIPAQFESDSPTSSTGTLRQFGEMDFRLFYSANITTYTDGAGNNSIPALAAPPSISAIAGVTSAAHDNVAVSARVVGNPAAGIQAVWVTFTATSGAYHGTWQSLDLTQSPTDSTLWQGTIPLNGVASSDLRYMIQAVNGVGVVAIDTKLGAYHTPDEFDSGNTAQFSSTAVQFVVAPGSGVYNGAASFSAKLTASTGAALPGQQMVFRMADQEVWATTDGNGIATGSLSLRSVPDNYDVKASFPGSFGLAPSFATSPFMINRQTTSLSITQGLTYVKPNTDTRLVATLTDGAGNPLNERTVLFILTGVNGTLGRAVITDQSGSAPLGAVAVPGGTYNVTVYFNGVIPLPGNPITLDDGRYVPTTTAGTLNITLVIDDQLPAITCPANIMQATDPGLCSAIVNFATTAQDDNPGVTLVSTPPSGTTFSTGTSVVNCVATDLAGNNSTCSFLVTVKDNEPPKISSPPDKSVNNDPGKCSAVVAVGTATATDNCGITPVVGLRSDHLLLTDPYPVGTTTITWTETDINGNNAVRTQKIVVTDNEPPLIACPGNKTVSADHGMCSAKVNIGTATATDNCGTTPVVAVRSDNLSLSAPYPVGITQVMWTETDIHGNSASCIQTITVRDTEPPTISCPKNLTVSNDPGKASAVVKFQVSAADNCQVANIVSTPASGSVFPLCTTTVTTTATDSSGNKSVSYFNVTVKDTEPPIIKSVSASPNILTPPDERFVLVHITVVATDNAGPVTSVITSVSMNESDSDQDWIITGPLTVKLEAERNRKGSGRTYTINVRCTDGSGNCSTGKTTVFVPL
jgi:hypothetical protein